VPWGKPWAWDIRTFCLTRPILPSVAYSARALPTTSNVIRLIIRFSSLLILPLGPLPFVVVSEVCKRGSSKQWVEKALPSQPKGPRPSANAASSHPLLKLALSTLSNIYTEENPGCSLVNCCITCLLVFGVLCLGTRCPSFLMSSIPPPCIAFRCLLSSKYFSPWNLIRNFLDSSNDRKPT